MTSEIKENLIDQKLVGWLTKYGVEWVMCTSAVVTAYTKEGKLVYISFIKGKHELFKFTVQFRYEGEKYFKTFAPHDFLQLFGKTMKPASLSKFQLQKPNIKYTLALLDKYRPENYHFSYYSGVCYVTLDNNRQIFLSLEPKKRPEYNLYWLQFDGQATPYKYSEPKLIELLQAKMNQSKPI